ncbi:FAS-associated death domain protein, partial [Poecilia reticulata]|uniref:FAS-associated death domain protein n=1 Tax=Poecilia reticulata TaxID=8081 RepID=UPI0007E9D972
IVIQSYKPTFTHNTAVRVYCSQQLINISIIIILVPQDKLDIATEVIRDNLGRNWRKLGRKLRLGETKLDSIATRQPTDLEETAMELLKEWRKIRGPEVQTKELIAALRDCQLNLTADKIQEKLEQKGLSSSY